MSENSDNKPVAFDDQEAISAIAYEPPSESAERKRTLTIRRGTIAILAVMGLAALFAVFLVSAKSIALKLQPADASINISGGFNLRIADRLLLRPGTMSVVVSADGYQEQRFDYDVSDASDQVIDVALDKLPGRISVNAVPTDPLLFIDGAALQPDEDGIYLIPAGEHVLRAEAPRYQPLEQVIEIAGMEQSQTIDVSMAPAWGNYTVRTTPEGASVVIDGEEQAKTPATLELIEGEHQIGLLLDGYEPEALNVRAVAGETMELELKTLRIADGKAMIRSEPSGATITLNGEYSGKTPIKLALRSGQSYVVEAFKAGYVSGRRTISLDSGASRDLTIKLEPVTGEVTVRVSPKDAEIWLGNRQLSTGSGTFNLPATRQQLSIRHAGYAEYMLAVTPRPGFAQTLSVSLLTNEQQRIASIKQQIKSPGGQELVLLRPTPFTMGASRREPGRRANEVLRPVKLRKPFYLSTKEVTNAEFRMFRSAHNSGNFKGQSLNGESQPAVNLSWQDAALYCNWLSEKEGLEAFYVIDKGTVVSFTPDSPGYRLPSEAEWSWAARMQSNGELQKFSWGNTPPPPKGRVGNYADRSAANLLGDVMQGYDDGYAVAAPVGSFRADRHGIHDLGGNAAEWIHDFYESALAKSQLDEDPLGPKNGAHHLIRGPSWRHGGISEIRLSFRDYGKDPRPDTGFRIARYLQ